MIREKVLEREKEYLNGVVEFLEREIKKGELEIQVRKKGVIEDNRSMWEEVAHIYEDDHILMDYAAYLDKIQLGKENHNIVKKKVDKYSKMRLSPYFGRIDFKEKGEEEEQIYIGLGNIYRENSYDILVYDWRSPVASMYYQCEVGECGYEAPGGKIEGEMKLKRQFKIEKSQLKYFFDANLKIDDDILQEVLGNTSSPKMKMIIETIQKDQDRIIRDSENKLLMVQGTAGSGKTSIAMHRIAYLLYHGYGGGLQADNMLIISPNSVFSKYISTILPELGEENVQELVLEDYALQIIEKHGKHIEKRVDFMERILKEDCEDKKSLSDDSVEFKGSVKMKEILHRMVSYYERKKKKFYDVSCDGKVIIKKEEMKEEFLNNSAGLPMNSRLKRIEGRVFNNLRRGRKDRVRRIEEYLKDIPEHQFIIPQLGRLLGIKKSRGVNERIRNMMHVDFFELYDMLFSSVEFFRRISKGIELPENIDEIIRSTQKDIRNGDYRYEDMWPLVYLYMKVQGIEDFKDIKHVVVDECQDYSPLQYVIMKEFFGGAGYTILGDINQALHKKVGVDLYEDIRKILNKKTWVRINMNKSYRSTSEIVQFSKKLVDGTEDIKSFSRSGKKPQVISFDNEKSMNNRIGELLREYKEEGLKSVGILCRDRDECLKLHKSLHEEAELIVDDLYEYKGGNVIMPVYMSKGLEFDGVIMYNCSQERYHTDIHMRNLYVASTRGLHRLEGVSLGVPNKKIV